MRPAASTTTVALLAAGVVVASFLPASLLELSPRAFLPFHLAAEGFAIVVSLMVFASGWSSLGAQRTVNTTLLACGFLAVGLIDFAHALSFQGMPEFVTASSGSKSIFFWLAARGIATLTLAGILVIRWGAPASRGLRHAALGVSLALTAVVYWVGLFHLDRVPPTYVPGAGLTPFKVHVEYVYIAVLLVTGAVFRYRARRPHAYGLSDLSAACMVTALSGLLMTRFTDLGDLFIVLGHLYKIVAHVFIYRAVFLQSFRAPYQSLQRSEQALRAADEQTKSILSATQDGFLLFDAATRVVEANDAYCHLTGYDRSELLGRSLAAIDVAPSAQEIDERLEQLRRQGALRLETRHRCKDGAPVDVEVSLSHLPYGDGRFFSFVRDIRERKQAESERTRLVAQLESAVAVRDEFLMLAAHELKTPLTALRLQLQAVVREAARPHDVTRQQVGRLAEMADVQVGRLARLVNDLLVVSFQGSTRLPLMLEELDLVALVRELVERSEPAAAAVGSSLSLSLAAPGPLVVRVDRGRLEQVLTNLVDNALKHAARRPVELRLEARAGRAHLSVRDHGVGLAKDELERIFGRYERVASTQNVTGLGLGLYVSRLLVEAHGGAVRAQSGPGDGATFVVELPLAAGTGTTS